MKRVMIILDGLGDEPIACLGGATPLEAAFAPNLHFIASKGAIGCIATTFEGFPIESMVCIMGLLGYAPAEFYPAGRAAFEAMGRGIALHEGDLVLRCNTVTVDVAQERLVDFTGGLITDGAAQRLIAQIRVPEPTWELHPGQSYRNILIIRGAGIDPRTLKCAEPHMHVGCEFLPLLPTGTDSRTKHVAEEIRRFLLDSHRQIAVGSQEDQCAANMLWVWSPSQTISWPSFSSRTGWTAALVGGLDFLNGIAVAANIHWQTVPGATGYIDTDYSAKARFAIKYIEEYDFVLVHVNAPDEEAHQRNWKGKIESIQKADRFLIGPILQSLEQKYKGDYKIVVCGDHATRCADGKHTSDLVPFAAYPAIEASQQPLSEIGSKRVPPISSLDFLKEVFG